MEMTFQRTLGIAAGLWFSLQATLISVEAVEYALVLHGGAGGISRETVSVADAEAYESALSEALDRGLEVLSEGGAAIDAVEAVIVYMEDNPLFNAGRGAVFTHEGRNELDASIMKGDTIEAGAVAGVRDLKNPIKAARAVMEQSVHVMLSGEGASEFGKEVGLQQVDPGYFRTEKRFEQLQKALAKDKHGTVGCVALDREGHLCAGTSTGGMTNKRWGRIGDSPVIGAGTYANDNTCGVSATGHGEYFIRYAVAHDISAMMEYKEVSLLDAANEVVNQKLKQAGGSGGIVALDSEGNPAMVFNTTGMFRAYGNSEGVRKVAMFEEEDQGHASAASVIVQLDSVLDRFHQAAAEADFDGYFSLFTKNGVFLGTDATERWTVEQFKDYAKPHFDRGKGWLFEPYHRSFQYVPGASHVPFDELLESEPFGQCRGSGVLKMEAGEWKVELYHLTIPIPNECAVSVVDLIRDSQE